MRSSCVVYGCDSSTYDDVEDKRSFHRFPNNIQDKSRHHRWVRFVSHTRKNFVFYPRALICGNHFRKDDFASKIIPGQRVILKKTAVPVIYPDRPMVGVGSGSSAANLDPSPLDVPIISYYYLIDQPELFFSIYKIF